MEDHSNRIYFKNLKKLIADNKIDLKSRVLVVCGGRFDEEVLKQLGFKNVLVTSIVDTKLSHYSFKRCDAQNLPFKDRRFDYTFVHAGLHHCQSPHRALLEMYRVSQKGVFVCEAHDNIFTRMLLKLKLLEAYEFSALTDGGGGVNDTKEPNFVYRWTKREVEKTIASYDFRRSLRIYYFIEFNFPKSVKKKKLYGPLLSGVARVFETVANKIYHSLGNSFCFYIDKKNMKYNNWLLDN